MIAHIADKRRFAAASVSVALLLLAFASMLALADVVPTMGAEGMSIGFFTGLFVTILALLVYVMSNERYRFPMIISFAIASLVAAIIGVAIAGLPHALDSRTSLIIGLMVGIAFAFSSMTTVTLLTRCGTGETFLAYLCGGAVAISAIGLFTIANLSAETKLALSLGLMLMPFCLAHHDIKSIITEPHAKPMECKTLYTDEIAKVRVPLACLAVIMLACSFICARTLPSLGHARLLSSLTIALSIVFLYFLVAFIGLSHKIGPVKLLRRLPFDAAIIILAAILALGEFNTGAVFALCLATCCIAILLLVSICLHDSRHRESNQYVLIGMMALVASFSAAIGNALCYAVSAYQPIQDSLASMLVAIIALPIAGGYLLLLGSMRKNRKTVASQGEDTMRFDVKAMLEQQSRSLAGKYGLTTRETEVLERIARSLTLQETCEELCISKNTVQSHQKNIYRKLGVHSKQEVKALLRASRLQDINLPSEEQKDPLSRV